MKELWKAFLNRRKNRKHIFLTPGVTESLAQNYLPWHYGTMCSQYWNYEFLLMAQTSY